MAAVGVFAGTNIDDIVVLTVLFLASRTGGRPRAWQIVTGQYAGITALVAASALAALGLTVIPDRWVGLLGLLPLGLGAYGLARSAGLTRALRAGHRDARPEPVVASGAASVAAVTVANGADNISVYTPMFRNLGVAESLVTVAVFAVLVALWCLAGSRLGGHRRLIEPVKRYGRWLVPGVFVLIGTTIVLESGVVVTVWRVLLER